MKVNLCLKCQEKAVYHRKYSGEKLCSNCFNNSLIEKTRKTISKYKMINYGDKVAIGVSGGKDSLALLDILIKIKEYKDFELIAITIDEGIANYREEAIEIALNAASKVGVKQVVLSFKELFNFGLDEALRNRKENKITSCAICGPLRRRAIEIGAKKVGANIIATGHNLDDILQSFMINLFSGDVYRIKAGDPRKEAKKEFMIRRIKPFMEIYETEIAFYSFLNELRFQTLECPHMNEGIRTEIRNSLDNFENKHSGIKLSLMKSMFEICENIKLNPKQLQSCNICGYNSSSNPCSTCKTVEHISELTRLSSLENI
jgi:uncharacterized protein (TIGR00269 family)